MKISIIGSGWLALPLAKQLQQSGHTTWLTSTTKEKVKTLQADGFNAIQYQLGEKAEATLLDCDVLIIAITHKELTDFQSLLHQLEPASHPQLIFISSTSVYANDGQTHDENSTGLNLENPLLAIENSIRSYPKSTIIRFAGLAGPGRNPGRFFVKSGVISNPSAAVNLIHLDDCIGIIETIIGQQAWNETYNGCADNHPEKGVYYQQMAQFSGQPIPKLADNQQGSNKIIDNQKVKQQLAYSFKYPDVFDFKFG